MIERKFVEDAIKNLTIDEYLEKSLEKADYSHSDMKVTPMSTRLIIHVGRPGVAIGKAGKNIQMLTDTLKSRFRIKNPQLDIKNIPQPDLDAAVVAKGIASAIERGMKHRRIVNIYLRNIMRAGALGAEITVSGKMGARSRTDKIGVGYIKKCGEMAQEYVKEGKAVAVLKAGTLGIKVKILPELPKSVMLEKMIAPKKETEDDAKKDEKKVEGEKKSPTPKKEGKIAARAKKEATKAAVKKPAKTKPTDKPVKAESLRLNRKPP